MIGFNDRFLDSRVLISDNETVFSLLVVIPEDGNERIIYDYGKCI